MRAKVVRPPWPSATGMQTPTRVPHGRKGLVSWWERLSLRRRPVGTSPTLRPRPADLARRILNKFQVVAVRGAHAGSGRQQVRAAFLGGAERSPERWIWHSSWESTIYNSTMQPTVVIPAFDAFLADRDLRVEAVILGGSALALLGVVTRTTDDCDVLDPEIPAAIASHCADSREKYWVPLARRQLTRLAKELGYDAVF